MTRTVISAEHLSKQYDLGVVGSGSFIRDFERWCARVRGKPDPYSTIGQNLAPRNTQGTILALDDVSFSVKEGEALGIIGRNGAGKSTLLKILSRVTAPSHGEVKINGRVGSLLEVGTGFHPELTGRENVFLNGTILGMKKNEVAGKFDEIVAFSGVEPFIDTPVKRYSSGMYVRLAFAVAAHLDPDILIVDEVLAVGDAEFQKKCLGKMGDVASQGRTVLFVSHSMQSIQRLCSQVLLLAGGRVKTIGETAEVIEQYFNEGQNAKDFTIHRGERRGDQQVSIEDFSITPQIPRTGKPLTCTLRLKSQVASADAKTVDISVSFTTDRGAKVFQLHSGHNQNGIAVPFGESRVEVNIPSLPLVPGRYVVNLWVGSGNSVFDWLPEALMLGVEAGSFSEDILIDNRGYPTAVPSTWSLREH